tara:strand:+ start:638 stop:1045 length:408 start_codon:yes stop_codon:yes gene_type:complete
MNNSDAELLQNLKIFCPENIINKYKHKQQQPKDWVRFYYYKNKRRHEVQPKNIEYDYEVSSTLNYNKNTFYKMTTMSTQDGYFDYYFKLKSHLPNVVVKKCNRHNKSEKCQQIKHPFIKKDYEITNDGKFVVRFD